ncbi:hypothetical protein DEO72_LG2g2688 [Vigna unguiculata]|uniref:Uncharacterized protein n=1 Tax=Vigna unguiculata TaxID=3917 RepID=A0A4D6L1I2_VIGUN|nr:hypothetical protein DEO72_LG2g2688 [Vigna unguiculata]
MAHSGSYSTLQWFVLRQRSMVVMVLACGVREVLVMLQCCRHGGDSCALVAAARWLVKLGVMVSAVVLVQGYSSVNGSRF